MILNKEQQDFISANLIEQGIYSEDLKEDILDHICIEIESGNENDFNRAYESAIKKFGGYSAIKNIQSETQFLLNENSILKKRKLVYITGFTVSMLLSTGTLFKMMHWPGANVTLLTGFLILNFILLPVHFFERYKTSLHKI